MIIMIWPRPPGWDVIGRAGMYYWAGVLALMMLAVTRIFIGMVIVAIKEDR